MSGSIFHGASFLIDKSAYVRVSLEPALAADFAAGTNAGLLYAHPAMLYEVLHSAQNGADFDSLRHDLLAYPFAPFDEKTYALALRAQTELAHHNSGFQRRFSMQDLLIAAAAHQFQIGVWHYDSDYDDILAYSSLQFESLWAAPQGSLGATGKRGPSRALKSSLSRAINHVPESARDAVVEDLLDQVEHKLDEAGVDIPERVTPN
jgi:predicted nucleic acid-binding protein